MKVTWYVVDRVRSGKLQEGEQRYHVSRRRRVGALVATVRYAEAVEVAQRLNEYEEAER